MLKAGLLIFIVMFCSMSEAESFQLSHSDTSVKYTYRDMPKVMPGTKALTWELSGAELSRKILNGAHKFINKKMDEAVESRSKLWHRDFSSKEAYELSVEPNRKEFMRNIGLVDRGNSVNYDTGLPDEHPSVTMQKISNMDDPKIISETSTYRIFQVRWPVLQGVYGEGLLLQPKEAPKANIIAIPDADQTPEQLVGLSQGISAKSQFARRLAEQGFQVLVPLLISRGIIHPEEPKKLQQTYREWIYKQAYHMGRHIIGFEVEKIMAAIDWFKQSSTKDLKIGVAGYCEGGLIAFYSAAVDKRIDAVLVSGYFENRRDGWQEPLYRNVWGLLSEFGDAEIATLIAPRPLVVEYSSIPKKVEESTKKPSHLDKYTATGYRGSLRTPSFEDVQSEFNRIDKLLKVGFQDRYLISSGNKPVPFGSEEALLKFTQQLGYHTSSMPISNDIPVDHRTSFKPKSRQVRQVKELEDYVQRLMHLSHYVRDSFFLYKAMPAFAKHPWSSKRYHKYYSPDQFIERANKYRKYFWEDIIGRFNAPMLPLNPRTRKVYDEKMWTGYRVVLDVYNNLNAAGVLLLPKDLKPGERRPVVVVQHGRDGLPKQVIEGHLAAYYNTAAKLANQGFIVFAPYGLFRGEDRYRWLDRKANTIKKTLFSFVISQHQQILKWLGTLPCVDSTRIAFYGISYGGETAMRVPAILKGYCLSICSGDFGNWARRVVGTHLTYGFMKSPEWEIPYFNMGNTFNYAELAYLIFPRPFMVERGHHDAVEPDSWVAYEYAKVKYLYVQFGLGDNTKIGYFNGGHAFRDVGTFAFLHKELEWP